MRKDGIHRNGKNFGVRCPKCGWSSKRLYPTRDEAFMAKEIHNVECKIK